MLVRGGGEATTSRAGRWLRGWRWARDVDGRCRCVRVRPAWCCFKVVCLTRQITAEPISWPSGHFTAGLRGVCEGVQL